MNNKVTIGGSAYLNSIELSAASPYIDFHYNRSTADYTARIIETSSGVLNIYGALTTNNYINGTDLRINGTSISSTFVTNSKLNQLLGDNMHLFHSWVTLSFTNGVATYTFSNLGFSGNTSTFVQSRDPNASVGVRYSHFNYVTKVLTVGLTSTSYNTTLGVAVLFYGLTN